jgi:hypothetical protein
MRRNLSSVLSGDSLVSAILTLARITRYRIRAMTQIAGALCIGDLSSYAHQISAKYFFASNP